METSLANRVALVTGAGSGIGRAIAIALAREGAAILVNDLDPRLAEEVADEVNRVGSRAEAVAGDVSDESTATRLVQTAESRLGPLRLAVNNAGIAGPIAPIAEIAADDWRRLMGVNLDAVFFGLRAQLPAIARAGGGAVVNVSSILGLVGQAFLAPYVTAKHAVTGLTKAAALEYAGQGVRVNSVHPGYVETALLAAAPAEALEHLATLHPVGRLGTTEEVADLVVFLLSERASFITGSQYLVDGGYTSA